MQHWCEVGPFWHLTKLENSEKKGQIFSKKKSELSPPLPFLSLIKNLINIQIEGDLIEVKLPESDLLWLVLRRYGRIPKGCCR